MARDVSRFAHTGLPDDLIRRILYTIARSYSDHGPDLGWTETVPSDDEYADVMIDLFRDSASADDDLTDDEIMAFHRLPRDQKEALALAVGP